jgi:Outer membrane lipoprotein-sorting protein
MNKPRRVLGALALLAWCPCPAHADEARQIMTEVQNRTQSKSEHYEGSLEVINSSQKISKKRWAYDRLGAYGNSKSELRFTAPPDVKGVALLVVNHPDRASDQWMWIPAEERDRRIALQDRSSRFFGTDFSFEDLEERDLDQYDFKLVGDDKLDDVDCWKIESRPKESKTSQYTSSLLWVRKDRYFLVRTDNFIKDRLVRQIAYRDVESIEGIWTALTVAVEDFTRNSRTLLTLVRVKYNLPMKGGDFTRENFRQ